MIAEIKGKISETGNLHERLEDQLTGNVFGTLRYLPFEMGLFPVLARSQYKCGDAASLLSLLQNVSGYDYNVEFWQSSEYGELDVVIEIQSCVIGIEVKYMSGLSSDDDVGMGTFNPEDEVRASNNQLARYARYLDNWLDHRSKHLILLAPASSAVIIGNDVARRRLIPPTVNFWVLTWQDVLHALANAEAAGSVEQGQRRVLADLVELLKRRGFDSFNGFDLAAPVISTEGFRYAEDVRAMWESVPVSKDLYYEFNRGSKR